MNVGSVDLLLSVDDSQFDPKIRAAVARAKAALSGIPTVKISVDDSAAQAKIAGVKSAVAGIRPSAPVRVTVDTSAASANLTALQRQIAGIRATSGRMGVGGVGRVGGGYGGLMAGGLLTAGVTRPALGLGTASVRDAAQFEASITKIASLTNIPRESIKSLHNEILGIANDPKIRQTPNELGKGFYYIASTVDDSSQALAALKSSALGASAGLGSTEQVAKTVTAAMSAWHISGANSIEITDKLTAAVKRGRVEAPELANALGKVAGTASIAGVSLTETLASLSTASHLLPADQAATGLNNLLLKIIRPSKGAEAAMKSLGTSSRELQKDLHTIGLQSTLQDLVQRTGGDVQTLSKLFPEIRAFRGVLVTQGVQAETYKKTLQDITNASGETVKAADTASTSFQASMDRLHKTVEQTSIVFGERLMPRIAEVADAFGKRLPAALDTTLALWDQLPLPLQKAAAIMGALVLLAGPLALTASTLGILGSAVGGLFAPLLAGTGVAAALAPIAAFAANPLVLALLGGTLLVGGLIGWKALSAAIDETQAKTKALSDNASHLEIAFAAALSATSDKRADARISSLQASVKAAGDDVEKLRGVLTKTTEAEWQIKQLGLAPNAADPVLMQIQKIKDYVESRTWHIGVTTEQTPTKDLPVGEVGTAEELAKRAESFGIKMPQTPSLWQELIGDETAWPKYHAELRRVQAEIAKAEKQRATGMATIDADLKRQAGLFPLISSAPPSNKFSDHAARGLEKYTNNLRELLKIQTDYNARVKGGWQPDDKDKESIGKVNARVTTLRDVKKRADEAAAKQAKADAKVAELAAASRLAAQQKALRDMATDAQLKELNQQISAWEGIGHVIESAGSAVDSLGEKTKRAQIAAQVYSGKYKGIPEYLKHAAVELGVIEDRTKRITGLRDSLKGVFDAAFLSQAKMGIDTAPFVARVRLVQNELDIEGKLTRLRSQGAAITKQSTVEIAKQVAARKGAVESINLHRRMERLPDGAATTGGTTPDYVQRMIARTGERTAVQCGQAISDAIGKPGFATAVARGTAGRTVQPVNGRFPDGTVVAQDYGKKTQHFFAVHTDANGVQRKVESTTAGGGRTYRSDRPITAKDLARITRAALPDGVASTVPAKVRTGGGQLAPMPLSSLPRIGKTPTAAKRPTTPSPEGIGKLLGVQAPPKSWGAIITDTRMLPGEVRSNSLALQNLLMDAKFMASVEKEYKKNGKDLAKAIKDARKAMEGADNAQAVQGVADNIWAQLRDMGKEIRLIGKENNPFLILQEEFKSGELRLATGLQRGLLNEMTRGLMVTKARQATKELRRDASNAVGGILEPAPGLDATSFDATGYDRSRFGADKRREVWASQDLVNLIQAGKGIEANRQATIRLDMAWRQFDATQAESAKRGMAESLRSLQDESDALAFNNGLIEQGITSRAERDRRASMESTRRDALKTLAPAIIPDGASGLERLRMRASGMVDKASADMRAAAAGAMTGDNIDGTARGNLLSDDIDARAASEARLKALGKQAGLQRSYAPDNPELQIQLQLLAKRNELEEGNRNALASAQVNVTARLADYEKEIRAEGELNRLITSRQNAQSVGDAANSAEIKAATMLVRSAAERLQIEYGITDAQRARQGIETSPEEIANREREVAATADTDAMQKVIDRAGVMRDAIRGGITTGIDEGLSKGIKSITHTLAEKMKADLIDRFSASLTNRIYGKPVIEKPAQFNLEGAGNVFDRLTNPRGTLPTTGGINPNARRGLMQSDSPAVKGGASMGIVGALASAIGVSSGGATELGSATFNVQRGDIRVANSVGGLLSGSMKRGPSETQLLSQAFSLFGGRSKAKSAGGARASGNVIQI